jgi:DNA-binding Lrp family transcriptional regulator
VQAPAPETTRPHPGTRKTPDRKTRALKRPKHSPGPGTGCAGRSGERIRCRTYIYCPRYPQITAFADPAQRDLALASATVAFVVTAFVLIDAEPARVAELAEEVAAVEGVAEAYSVAGQADIVAVVRVRQIEDLAEVVTRRLHALAGVADTRTLVAFQSYSRKDLDEIWELGAD